MSTPTYDGRILLIGLPADHEIVQKSGVDPEMIRVGIIKVGEALKAAGYVGFEFYPLAPDFENWQQKLTATLTEGKVDGVVIGFGLRGMAPLTVFFESLVNTIVAASPKTKFAFNSDPQSTMDAVKRQFPISS